MKASKVFVVVGDMTTMGDGTVATKFSILYVSWPEETTANLINELKSINLQLSDDTMQMSRKQLHDTVVDTQVKNTRSIFFNEVPRTPNADIDHLNST